MSAARVQRCMLASVKWHYWCHCRAQGCYMLAFLIRQHLKAIMSHHRYTSEQPFAGLTPQAVAELKCRSPPWRLVFPPGTPVAFQVHNSVIWLKTAVVVSACSMLWVGWCTFACAMAWSWVLMACIFCVAGTSGGLHVSRPCTAACLRQHCAASGAADRCAAGGHAAVPAAVCRLPEAAGGATVSSGGGTMFHLLRQQHWAALPETLSPLALLPRLLTG